jgi:hypothetical protein
MSGLDAMLEQSPTNHTQRPQGAEAGGRRRAETDLPQFEGLGQPNGSPTGHLVRRSVMIGNRKLLDIYLNDHLAGATLGAELARRLAASHRDSPAAAELERLASEVGEDRAALLKVMAALGTPVARLKVYGGWAIEKAARLKLNGHLRTRSPLSSLLELEGMRLGVEGKAAGWRTLRTLADSDNRLDAALLDDLLTRAHAQSDTLEEIRIRMTPSVFACS